MTTPARTTEVLELVMTVKPGMPFETRQLRDSPAPTIQIDGRFRIGFATVETWNAFVAAVAAAHSQTAQARHDRRRQDWTTRL